MPFNMGPGEILLIFLLIIILFGAKRLPDLARSLGKSIKEFKHATQGLRDEFDVNKIDDKPAANIPPRNNEQVKTTETGSGESQKSSSESAQN